MCVNIWFNALNARGFLRKCPRPKFQSEQQTDPQRPFAKFGFPPEEKTKHSEYRIPYIAVQNQGARVLHGVQSLRSNRSKMRRAKCCAYFAHGPENSVTKMMLLPLLCFQVRCTTTPICASPHADQGHKRSSVLTEVPKTWDKNICQFIVFHCGNRSWSGYPSNSWVYHCSFQG